MLTKGLIALGLAFGAFVIRRLLQDPLPNEWTTYVDRKYPNPPD